MALYELRDLGIAFNGNVVLNGLDLDIHRGEFLTLFGESGSGKSLILKSLIGLVTMDRGTMHFDGQDVSRLDDDAWSRLRPRVGMLFQESALFDSLNVLDNVAYGLREQRALDESAIRERVSDSLALVGLPGIERLWPASLSGGMKKRVALARAVAMRPEILLYDEPTEGLDPINVTRVNNMLLALQRNLDITTVVVTHNMQSAFGISTRVAFLSEGQIALEGPPDEVAATNDPRLSDFLRASRDPIADRRAARAHSLSRPSSTT